MLELVGVSLCYGVARALRGVSLRVPEGSVVALPGANGAGKTSALRAISGVAKISEGRIELDSRQIQHESSEVRVRLGVVQVLEGRQVFPDFTVREDLMIGAYLRSGRAGISADLDMVFSRFPVLAERASQAAGTLSGGEQQMLAIARALMARPRILLLDEPSLGLAPLVVREIFAIIRDINRSGATVLLLEQNARLALRISTYAYVLENGAVKLEGPSKELEANEIIARLYLGGSSA